MEEKARQRERDEIDKLVDQRNMMKAAEIEDRRMKLARRQQELVEEERFKNIMMQKFLEDERKEKHHNDQRRQREINHKKEVNYSSRGSVLTNLIG